MSSKSKSKAAGYYTCPVCGVKNFNPLSDLGKHEECMEYLDINPHERSGLMKFLNRCVPKTNSVDEDMGIEEEEEEEQLEDEEEQVEEEWQPEQQQQEEEEPYKDRDITFYCPVCKLDFYDTIFQYGEHLKCMEKMGYDDVDDESSIRQFTSICKGGATRRNIRIKKEKEAEIKRSTRV